MEMMNMSNRTDNKELQENLMSALGGAKKARADMENKEWKRIWRDIQVPISLNAALSRLTKDELTSIRQKLDIKNASSLKKEQLIQLLQQVIPSRFEKICLTIDTERYSIIEKIANQGGSVNAEHLPLETLKNLGNHGLVFTGSYNGEKVAVIPDELMAAFQSIDHSNIKTTIDRNTEWIKLTHGLLYYYGVLSNSKLIEMVKKYSAFEMGDSLDFFKVINEAEDYYEEIRSDWNGFSHIDAFNPEHILNEQNKRPGIPYYPFSKSELIAAGVPDYMEQNNSFKQFEKFITQHYEVSREEAEMTVDQCAHGVKLGESPNDILHLLQQQFEMKGIDDVKLFMDHLINLSNNTRQWFLKGFTAKEVHQLEKGNWRPSPGHTDNVVDFQSRKKVGRNDPCPCGSGKKYKKCCGR
ncbi:hypothetical protein FH966_10280 [Lentibacillus cibarius]|uniref:Zinc chelation protein SecC n=2 Tax=Lentibacillus cibarius TaxID=2583219 RepID=A0A549YJH7_9BACI|nr:hypothetical protein FH966_10280 [Lentibacillus cibarius]